MTLLTQTLQGRKIGYEVRRESLTTQRKGMWQKALLAAMVKKHCAVSNEWIANRPAIGRLAGMSKVGKLYRKQGGRKNKALRRFLWDH